MAATSANHYLRTRVLTAGPQQLRLMLYDGAIKFCRRGRDGLKRGDYDQSYDGVSRAQRIILELASTLGSTVEPTLRERMAALYDFIYRQLIEVNTQRDAQALDDCIELIEHERQTWRMLIDRMNRSDEEAEEAGTEALGEHPALASSAAASGMPSSIGFSAEG